MRNFVQSACLCFATIGCLALTNASIVSAQTTEGQELREQTREDILDAYAILAEHHPGMQNPFDPEFAHRLETARDEALRQAQAANTEVDRFLAVQVINKTLADGHARVQIAFNGGMGLRPGFDAAWRGDGLYVTSNQPLPSRGAKLLSCDGEAAIGLIEEEVFRASGRPAEAGQWWVSAGGFFSRGDLSVKPAPEICRFQSIDGGFETVELQWRRPTREGFIARIEAAQPDPLGMRLTDDGLRWITLSSFSPGPEGIAEYERIFAELDALIDTPQLARAIVLDLRGNKGGSSSWSRKIANRLWGEEAVAWAMANYFRETEIWYLADEGNIEHFGTLAPELRELGLPDIADWAEEMHGSLSAARDSDETFYRQHFGEDLLADAEPTMPRDLPPVYVITDGACASACLDAVDTFTQFEGVTLVGAPTSADTEYLEVRRENLPSGRGLVILPTKIWVRRPREAGEVYHPDLLVTDLDWTTESMAQAILNDLNGD